HIKRPENCWVLFRKDKQKEIIATEGKLPRDEMSKRISKLWKSLPQNIRYVYECRAARMKLQHQLDNQGYQYQPKR
ncbi:high mobility group box domain-containing protein, partial [Cyathus striatus]